MASPAKSPRKSPPSSPCNRLPPGRLGSVSDYSVHHCACPVVVVRFPDDKDGEDEKSGENGAEKLVESDKLHTVPEVAEEEGDKDEYHDASDKQQAGGDLPKET
ncbi:hypothetical protein Bca52824_062480 [Brassica carinata]|uniref:Uncharacterized protein n=1 Tax=Brassica carinata TaxID=52824 RepID=A0A8X7QFV7_BRACI|nr:hypothetical protein Bca52824_062480 [Brassica carinata]